MDTRKTKLIYVNDTCKKNSNCLINQATGLKKPSPSLKIMPSGNSAIVTRYM